MRFAINDDLMYEKILAHCAGDLTGCYRLVVVQENGQPIPIRRMLGDDQTGTLYIGASTNLPYRMANLKKAVLASYGQGGYINPFAHCGAAKLTEKSRAQFPDTNAYHVEIYKNELTENSVQINNIHFAEEAKLLESYHDEWGEYPPLNG